MAIIKYKVTTAGGQQENEYELTSGEISIGRDPDNQIVLNDNQASRHHARILSTAQGFMLLDNNSANGTYVKNMAITYYLLHHGDVIHIGDTFFSFYEFEQEAPSLSDGANKDVVVQPVPGSPGYLPPAPPPPPVQYYINCPTCTQAIPEKSQFCIYCGNAVQPGRPLPLPLAEKPKRRIFPVVIVLLLLGSAMAAGYYMYKHDISLTKIIAGRLNFGGVAPELADYSDRITMHGKPQSFTVDKNGGSTMLVDGSRIEVAGGVFETSTKFDAAMFDLVSAHLPQDATQVRFYMLSADINCGFLNKPVIVTFSVSSKSFSIDELIGQSWVHVPLPDGVSPKIEIDHFSKRYYKVTQWNKGT